MLQHVLDAAEESAAYVNKYSSRTNITVSTAILIPFKDEIGMRYKNKSIIFEGDEHDVLTRYVEFNKEFNADFVVRITSDCPLLPSYIISKCINIATKGEFDYVSNVDENLRTSVDGFDVEVISFRALEWIDQNVKDIKFREHVTLYLRGGSLPSRFKVAHVIGHLYQPDIKLSVDTEADLERVRAEYSKIKDCIDKAIRKHGVRSVFRI